MEPFVKFEHVKKVYHMGEITIEALRDASFEIEKGEICVIVGPSGAGKTTLLNILGGMDTLSEGRVFLDGKEISKYNARELTTYRRYEIGFVFQFYNLIQNLTALENVSLAAQICKDPMDAGEALAKVGLASRINNFPAQLSGGEQQRVAIARALAKNPKLLLCDEPTGALDYNTGKAILKLLQDTAHETGMTVVIITHNTAIAPMADRIIHVKTEPFPQWSETRTAFRSKPSNGRKAAEFMKNAMTKSTLREIKGSFSRWIAILAICALGVGFFCGLKICKEDFILTGDTFYAQHNFYDYELMSTLGLEEKDVPKCKPWTVSPRPAAAIPPTRFFCSQTKRRHRRRDRRKGCQAAHAAFRYQYPRARSRKSAGQTESMRR